MRAAAQKLVDDLHIKLDVSQEVSRLSVAQKQIVEICKALSFNAEWIIMDEPSATLTENELELAERISDTVVCVAGDRIDRIGTPEEIFTREYIAKLYRMEHGKYDPCFDSLEFVP